jgi:hypothetical protein
MTKRIEPASEMRMTLAMNVACEVAAVSTLTSLVSLFKVCDDVKGVAHLKSNIHTSTSGWTPSFKVTHASS